MKLITSLCFVSTTILCLAQENIPKRIFYTIEEASHYFKTTAPENLALLTYFEDEDPEMYRFFINRPPGDIIITGTEAYKIVGFKNARVQRCSIIQLDPALSINEIEKQEKIILQKYKDGIPFGKLFEQYSTDKNSYMLDNLILLDDTNNDYASAMATHPDYKIFVFNNPEWPVYRIILKNGEPVTVKSVSVLSPDK